MNSLEAVIIIPSFKPDEKMLCLVRELLAAGFARIVVVDDGSGTEYEDIFRRAEELGCILERHEKNFGKGAAIKTALRAVVSQGSRKQGEGVFQEKISGNGGNCGHRGSTSREEREGKGGSDCPGYITADADGQHLVKDILRVAEALVQHPEALILGSRDFSGKDVPPRSRFGNRVTSVLFRLISGVACSDTQTGLRGIPAGLLELALSEEGERYEYEMNFLMDAARKVPFYAVPIETVYEEKNRTSHFRPIADSLRVYGRFVRFALASIAGAVVDYLLFSLLTPVLAFAQTETIFLATAIARVGSGMVNFGLNRYFSFRSRMPAGREVVRYAILFLGQMWVSAGLVSLLAQLQFPILGAKVIVDTILFFFSFRIQKNWVFAGGE